MRKLFVASVVAAAILPLLAEAHEIPVETPIEYRIEAGAVVERPIALIFDDFHLQIRDRESRDVLLTLRYAEILRMKYENAAVPEHLKGHTLPASASRQHWLTFYFQQDGKDQTLLLALDEYDYDIVLRMTQMLSEKPVEGTPEEE